MTESVDLRLKFKQTEGDVLVRGIVNSVNESIAQIIETSQGTRLFNRGFGAGLMNLLFEPMGQTVADMIMLTIDQAIEREEPRARLLFDRSEVQPDYDNNGYNVRIVYRILGREELGEFDTFLSAEGR